MTDDLVIEARKGGPCAELGNRCRTIEAASGCFCAAVADRIEALTADRDRLRAASDDVIRETFASYRQAEEAYAAHLRVEADNARLREALEYILAECTLSDNTMPSVGAIKYAARAALKGETP